MARSDNAPRPWGMQDTSPKDLMALDVSSKRELYHVGADDGSGTGSSTGFRMGRKSICSARANLAAVRKDMLTSPESTFATYGRETFIRLARAVCERPRDFIRRISFLRNAEPILSIAFTVNSVTDLLRGCQGFACRSSGTATGTPQPLNQPNRQGGKTWEITRLCLNPVAYGTVDERPPVIGPRLYRVVDRFFVVNLLQR